MNIRHLRRSIPLACAASAMAAAGVLAAVPAASAAPVTVTAKTAAASYGGSCVRHTYGYGSWGNCVADIQLILDMSRRWDGGYQGSYLNVDGGFGRLTYGQVRYFQWFTGLRADGVVGPATWSKLCMDAQWSNDISAYYNAGCSS